MATAKNKIESDADTEPVEQHNPVEDQALDIAKVDDDERVHVIVMGPVLGASVGDVVELSAAEARQYAGYVMPIASPNG